MIKLEETFTSGVGGFTGQDVLTYRQLIRSEKAAIYERSRDGVIKDYEVITIKINPKGFQVFNGKPLEDDTEMYPSTGQFGFKAWSFHGSNGKQAAINKFNELNTDQAVKNEENEMEEVVNSNTTFIFPSSATFSTRELADTNKTEYITASLWIKDAVKSGIIKSAGSERRNVKGKATNLFSKV